MTTDIFAVFRSTALRGTRRRRNTVEHLMYCPLLAECSGKRGSSCTRILLGSLYRPCFAFAFDLAFLPPSLLRCPHYTHPCRPTRVNILYARALDYYRSKTCLEFDPDVALLKHARILEVACITF